MSIEILGMIGHRLSSETIAPVGPVLDKDYITRFAQAHEQAGFDRVLVGYWSDQPDGFLVTALAGLATKKLGLLLAHRPGFIAPTLAARKLATLDHLLDGRLAINVVSGGNDGEQRKDGDFSEHDQRYARTDEYLDVLKHVWTAEQPFNHDGHFYQAEQAFSQIKCAQRPHIPVYFGGASPAALNVAAKHADVYMLWGESLAQTREILSRVKALAAQRKRQQSYSLSFRPIIADTEQAAWAKADEILEQARERQSATGPALAIKPQSEGAKRLMETTKLGERVDSCLWTGIAKLVGGGQNSTALVGTPEQVAEAIAEYYRLGVEHILMRGFDPLNDAVAYGEELIPLIRAKTQAIRQSKAG